MKLAIYGDSFAEASKDYHWVNLLKKEFKADLSNTGKSGTPVNYAYTKFKQRYKVSNLNIFIATDPNRYIKQITDIYDNPRYVTSYNHLKYLSTLTVPNSKTKLVFDPNLMQQLEGWYLSSDSRYNDEVSTLMVEKIITMDPDVVVIPAFSNSFNKQLFKKIGLETKNNLFDMVGHQLKLLNLDNTLAFQFDKENPRLIDGHFTQEMHEMFFHMVLNRIKNKEWNWTLPNKINFQFEPLDYYKP
jgi:hypothetical protein